MTTNQVRWLKNLFGDKQPLIILGRFAAGSTTPVKRGQILALASSVWAPLAADQAMDGTIAIANEEIKAGDLAGYYEIIVPRPGDVFEFSLAAASAIALGTELYYSDSETLTVTAGTNVIARAADQTNYPPHQGHLSADAAGDSGTTIRSVSKVGASFDARASYWSVLQRAGHLPAIIATLTAASGTPSTTIADVTATPTQTLINNNFASVATQLNLVINALISAGIIKES